MDAWWDEDLKNTPECMNKTLARGREFLKRRRHSPASRPNGRDDAAADAWDDSLALSASVDTEDFELERALDESRRAFGPRVDCDEWATKAEARHKKRLADQDVIERERKRQADEHRRRITCPPARSHVQSYEAYEEPRQFLE